MSTTTGPRIDLSSSFAFSGLSLTEDGNVLAVGDRLHVPASLEPGYSKTYLTLAGRRRDAVGEVRIYHRDGGSPLWSINQVIAPQTLESGTQEFGVDCQLTPDGTTLVVGSWSAGQSVTPTPLQVTLFFESGSLVAADILDEVGNSSHSEPGYAASGTFTITSATDPGFVAGTPAVVGFTSVNGIITSFTVVTAGSGYSAPDFTPVLVAAADLPARTEQQFWATSNPTIGDNAYMTRAGQGKIHVYTHNGSQFVFARKTETLNWLSENKSPYLGTTIDVTANGKTVVAAAPNEGYEQLLSGTTQPGMAVIYEEVTPPDVPLQVRTHASIVWPGSTNDYSGGMIPFVPAAWKYGVHHKMSADGSTIVVGRSHENKVDVFKTADGGQTWTLDATLTISDNNVEKIRGIDVTNDGTKIVALYLKSVTSATQRFQRVCQFETWIFAGSPASWSSVGLYGSLGGTSSPIDTNSDIAMSGDGSRIYYGIRDHFLYPARSCTSTLSTGLTTGVGAITTPGMVGFLTTAAGITSATDVITTLTDHPFQTGDAVEYAPSLGAPAPPHPSYTSIGITRNTICFVRRLSNNTLTLHTTDAGAVADTGRYNLTASGTTETQYLMGVNFIRLSSSVNVSDFGSEVRYFKGLDGNGQVVTDDIGLVDGQTYWARYTEGDGIRRIIIYPDRVSAESRNTNWVPLIVGDGVSSHYFQPTDLPLELEARDWDSLNTQWVSTGFLNMAPRYGASNNPLVLPNAANFRSSWGCGLAVGDNGIIVAAASSTKVSPTDENKRLSGPRSRELTLMYEVDTIESTAWYEFLTLANGPYTIQYLDSGEFESLTSVSASGDIKTVLFLDRALNHAYVLEADVFTTDVYVWKQLLQSDTPLVDVGFTGEGETETLRGGAISNDGTVIAIGAYKENSEQGGLYIFRRVNDEWRREQYITAPCLVTSGRFGYTVSINSDGTLVSVAAPGVDQSHPGQINIFSITPPVTAPTCPVPATAEVLGNTMILQTVVNPEELIFDAAVGQNISMDATGTRVVVGGPTPRIFIKSGSQWVLEQELILPGAPAIGTRKTNGYGTAVALNSTGDMVAVGAPNTVVSPGTANNGKIHIFTRSGVTWTYDNEVYPAAGLDDDYFGFSVAVSGTNIVVSSTYPGTGYLFRKITGTWTEASTAIIPPPPGGSPLAGGFGEAITYVNNGASRGTIAMGGTALGTAYVWMYDHDYSGAETITYAAEIDGSLYSTDTGFGQYDGYIRFSSDGSHLVISSPSEVQPSGDGYTAGRVVVFQNTNGTSNNFNPAGPWNLIDSFIPMELSTLPLFINNPNNTIRNSISFGTGIGVSSNGNRIVVGTYDFSLPDTLNSVNALLYSSGGAWVYEKQLSGTYSPVPERRAFTQGPNGQTINKVATNSDASIIAISSSFASASNITPGSGRMGATGQAQIFEYGAVNQTASYSYTDTIMLEDYNQNFDGTAYGEGSHALSRDGNTIAVSYGNHTSNEVDVYIKSGPTWVFQATVNPGLTTGVDRIKISDDGNVMVCFDFSAAPYEMSTLTRSGATWTAVDLQTVSSDTVGSYEAALSGDGLTLFVMGDITGINTITVYAWNAGTTSWDVEDSTTINATDVEDFDTIGFGATQFGYGMSCSANGNWFVTTGSRAVDLLGPTYSSPCAYVYTREGSPAGWKIHTILPAFWFSQQTNIAANISNVRMNAAGTAFVMSSPLLNRLYVFVKDQLTDRSWNLDGVLTYEDATGDGNDALGYVWGADISDDASLVFGSQSVWPQNTNAGRVIVWRKIGGLWRVEDVVIKPTGSPSAPAIGSVFGASIATDSTGTTITASDQLGVGSPAVGALWVFNR